MPAANPHAPTPLQPSAIAKPCTMWRAWLALCVACTALPLVQAAERPFFRDPVWDGAADASFVFKHGRGRWEMFYTNRRATLRLDLSLIHI